MLTLWSISLSWQTFCPFQRVCILFIVQRNPFCVHSVSEHLAIVCFDYVFRPQRKHHPIRGMTIISFETWKYLSFHSLFSPLWPWSLCQFEWDWFHPSTNQSLRTFFLCALINFVTLFAVILVAVKIYWIFLYDLFVPMSCSSANQNPVTSR